MILVLLAMISCCYTYNLLKLPSAHTYVRPMLLFGVMKSPSHSAITPEDVRPKTSIERQRELSEGKRKKQVANSSSHLVRHGFLHSQVARDPVAKIIKL